MAIFLASTTDIIQLKTGTNQSIDMYVSYIDDASGVFSPGAANGNVASASTVTLLGSPASSTVRNVKFVSITNTDASNSCVITLYYSPDNGTTKRQIGPSFALGPQCCWTSNDLEGFVQNDAAGGRVETPLSGRFLKSTLETSGTTGTTGPSTNSIKIRMVGAGGQGGGCSAVAGCAGSGGGSGGYAEKTFAVTPNTAYTYAIGAGGTTGGTGANGQAGGNTTFTVGATTVTAFGGGGGLNGAALAVAQIGGAGGAVSTNGDLNAAGEPGYHSGNGAAAADNVSGAGGSSQFGGGANGIAEATNTTGSSAAALGFGGGGGGAATSATTARAGGAGASGCIWVDEYS